MTYLYHGYDIDGLEVFMLNDGKYFSISVSLDKVISYFYSGERKPNGSVGNYPFVRYSLDACVILRKYEQTATLNRIATLSPFATTPALIRKLHPELFI